MTDEVFSEKNIIDGEKSLTLGPAYFASRDIAERFMAKFEAEHFKPMLNKFTMEFRDLMWTDMSTFLMSDTESNLQGEMWRQADRMVEYLVSGEPWALQKFVLNERYDFDKVRKAIAAHIPQELQDARITFLEGQITKLKEENARLDRRVRELL